MNQNKNSEFELSEQAYKYLKEQNDYDLKYHTEKAGKAECAYGIMKEVNDEMLAVAHEIHNLLSHIKVIGETELLLNSAEAIRKADNRIIHLRMQEALLSNAEVM